jgi:hypothetical protein
LHPVFLTDVVIFGRRQFIDGAVVGGDGLGEALPFHRLMKFVVIAPDGVMQFYTADILWHFVFLLK